MILDGPLRIAWTSNRYKGSYTRKTRRRMRFVFGGQHQCRHWIHQQPLLMLLRTQISMLGWVHCIKAIMLLLPRFVVGCRSYRVILADGDDRSAAMASTITTTTTTTTAANEIHEKKANGRVIPAQLLQYNKSMCNSCTNFGGNQRQYKLRYLSR